jgi:LPS-assembly lipoprotein
MRPRYLPAVLALLQLSGCGFHLRGKITLPNNVSALSVQSADDLNPLRLILERQLEANQLLDKAAPVKLEIVSDALSRETLSVNDQARVSEFVLRYQVQYRLLEPGKDAATPSALEVRREYSFDETQALGAAQEEAIIAEDLHREMASLILLRLQKAKNAP